MRFRLRLNWQLWRMRWTARPTGAKYRRNVEQRKRGALRQLSGHGQLQATQDSTVHTSKLRPRESSACFGPISLKHFSKSFPRCVSKRLKIKAIERSCGEEGGGMRGLNGEDIGKGKERTG